MRRSFKAATIFAGVGAATGMFAPAALAAPTHTTAAAKPDINPAKVCGANNGGVSTWVHLFYPKDDHPAECVGGKGYEPLKATIFSFCAGNNNGYLYASRPFSFNYTDARAPIGNDQVYGITINSWYGNNKCT